MGQRAWGLVGADSPWLVEKTPLEGAHSDAKLFMHYHLKLCVAPDLPRLVQAVEEERRVAETERAPAVGVSALLGPLRWPGDERCCCCCCCCCCLLCRPKPPYELVPPFCSPVPSTPPPPPPPPPPLPDSCRDMDSARARSASPSASLLLRALPLFAVVGGARDPQARHAEDLSSFSKVHTPHAHAVFAAGTGTCTGSGPVSKLPSPPPPPLPPSPLPPPSGFRGAGGRYGLRSDGQ